MNIRTFKHLTPWTYRASWGTYNIKEGKESVSMEVKGRRFSGKVQVAGGGSRITVMIGKVSFRCNEATLAHEMDVRIES